MQVWELGIWGAIEQLSLEVLDRGGESPPFASRLLNFCLLLSAFSLPFRRLFAEFSTSLNIRIGYQKVVLPAETEII